MQFIYTYDLNGLRELWGHLDQKMFAKLESEFAPGKNMFAKLDSEFIPGRKILLTNPIVSNQILNCVIS